MSLHDRADRARARADSLVGQIHQREEAEAAVRRDTLGARLEALLADMTEDARAAEFRRLEAGARARQLKVLLGHPAVPRRCRNRRRPGQPDVRPRALAPPRSSLRSPRSRVTRRGGANPPATSGRIRERHRFCGRRAHGQRRQARESRPAGSRLGRRRSRAVLRQSNGAGFEPSTP